MPLTLSLVAAGLTLAAAPVRLDRVDLLSEDEGTFLNYDMPLFSAYAPITGGRFLEQVKVVLALPVSGLYAGASIASQSISYEGPLLRSQDGRGLFWVGSVHTRLLMPYGAHAGVAWRFGLFRLGVGASLSTEATWVRPEWNQWRVLPVLAVGLGPNVAPGM
ncbi:hypothetical protein D187_008756 [Cystobacter fuscus DSM 2262]|uniref:Uncharacterized protein n=1 Tax=Cystobacter fuscus (strain ATCC 25194 / DSM 2262 / NBRC 100088 / M29) TaxID=1242864 RepID=S9R0Y6_CYSF2|nr:hypothetical protein [Cystobacter fuscus]EPX62568.1 hypothetical protein D187_008756 [Cystobacter fuscus DSM 2262]